jgi:hypothetical protein
MHGVVRTFEDAARARAAADRLMELGFRSECVHVQLGDCTVRVDAADDAQAERAAGALDALGGMAALPAPPVDPLAGTVDPEIVERTR